MHQIVMLFFFPSPPSGLEKVRESPERKNEGERMMVEVASHCDLRGEMAGAGA